MSNNYLPSLCGQLAINFQNNFKSEKQLHTTDTYLEQLSTARANIQSHDGCCYCGFQDGRFLELHHADHNHDNNHEDNLFLICTLCHRLNHLGWVGSENLGKIFYIPRPTNLEEGEGSMWLEPINNIQRFYLMTDYLTNEQKERLFKMPLTTNIYEMLTAMKRQDINENYRSAKEEKAKRAEEVERLRNASANDKEKVAKEIEERRKSKTENVKTESHFHDLHLLDLLQAIVDCEDNIKDNFLKTQSIGDNGRMTIWFNQSVFEPFEPNPEYTLQERLEHYRDMDLFSASGLSNVMHNLRKTHQFTN